MSRERIVHEVGEWQNAAGQFIPMLREYPTIAELADRVSIIRKLRAELRDNPVNEAALRRRGSGGLREEHAVITREDVKNGLLVFGIISIAAETKDTKIIGGATDALGNSAGLSVITEDSSVAEKYRLPLNKFHSVENLLLSLAALAENGRLPPMTEAETRIQAAIMRDINELDDLNKRRRKLVLEGDTNVGAFSLSSKRWRFDEGETKFWLNPECRERYQSGWYTLLELQQWLAGQGRVIKAKG